VLVLIELRIASGLPFPDAVVATVAAVVESSFLPPPHPLATSASASVAPTMGFQTFMLDSAFLPFPGISLSPRIRAAGPASIPCAKSADRRTLMKHDHDLNVARRLSRSCHDVRYSRQRP
jgi:hypothetical protein